MFFLTPFIHVINSKQYYWSKGLVPSCAPPEICNQNGMEKYHSYLTRANVDDLLRHFFLFLFFVVEWYQQQRLHLEHKGGLQMKNTIFWQMLRHQKSIVVLLHLSQIMFRNIILLQKKINLSGVMPLWGIHHSTELSQKAKCEKH